MHFLSRMSTGVDWKKSLQPLHEPGTFDTDYLIYCGYLGVIEKVLGDACGCKKCSQCLMGALIANGGGPELSAGQAAGVKQAGTFEAGSLPGLWPEG